MKKYYYRKYEDTTTCKESCKVKGGDRMIGSWACKTQCFHCCGFDKEEGWIKCDVIDKATMKINKGEIK